MWISAKRKEHDALRLRPHPYEFSCTTTPDFSHIPGHWGSRGAAFGSRLVAIRSPAPSRPRALPRHGAWREPAGFNPNSEVRGARPPARGHPGRSASERSRRAAKRTRAHRRMCCDLEDRPPDAPGARPSWPQRIGTVAACRQTHARPPPHVLRPGRSPARRPRRAAILAAAHRNGRGVPPNARAPTAACAATWKVARLTPPARGHPGRSASERSRRAAKRTRAHRRMCCDLEGRPPDAPGARPSWPQRIGTVAACRQTHARPPPHVLRPGRSPA